MKKQMYLTPEAVTIELRQEGIVCSSEIQMGTDLGFDMGGFEEITFTSII